MVRMRQKISLLVLSTAVYFLVHFLTPTSAFAFWVGFNQAWIQNSYSSQWASQYDENEFARVFDLARAAHATRIRLWLFEGMNPENILMVETPLQGNNPTGLKERRIVGFHPLFLSRLERVMQMADERGIQLHLTLFDGNLSRWEPPTLEVHNFWWNLFNDKFGIRQDFIQKIYLPLLSALDRSPYAHRVEQVDLVNEINALTYRDSAIRFENRWNGANQFACQLRNLKWNSGYLPNTRVTASVGWNYSVENVLNGDLKPQCVDTFVIHLYNYGGDIPRCQELIKYAQKHGKKMQLGEFGQGQVSWESDWLQSITTRNFLMAASACGFEGAMPWRLSGHAGGEKFLFIKGTKVRPAYYEFKRTAKELGSH